MKILFLSQRFLLPADTGGKIRTGKILEQLAKFHEITVVSNVESPKDDAYVPEMKRFCDRFVPVPWIEIKRHTLLFYIRLLFQMLSPLPVTVLNSYSRRLRKVVEFECDRNDYDLAICDFVQTGMTFKNVKSIPTLLFQHNVESTIVRRHIDQAKNRLAKVFWWLQWRKLLRYEAKRSKSFNRIIAVSEQDKDLFKKLYGLDNVSTIPTGVDTSYYSPSADNAELANSLVFCGSMDWLPNEDAIYYFSEHIYPDIKMACPDARLTIVGRQPSPGLNKFARSTPGVELTGWVQDTRPYILNSSLFIVPLRIGGGTRMKIYEAMAMGKTVVSTSIGAEGLDVTNGNNIVIEDDPRLFAKRVIELLGNRNLRTSIGNAACRHVHQNYSWLSVSEAFSDICRDTVKTQKDINGANIRTAQEQTSTSSTTHS